MTCGVVGFQNCRLHEWGAAYAEIGSIGLQCLCASANQKKLGAAYGIPPRDGMRDRRSGANDQNAVTHERTLTHRAGGATCRTRYWDRDTPGSRKGADSR